MSYLSVGTVPVRSDGLNSALSPVVYGDIALSIKINTQIHKIHNKMDHMLHVVFQILLQ